VVYILHLPRELSDGLSGLSGTKHFFPQADEKFVGFDLAGAKLDFPAACTRTADAAGNDDGRSSNAAVAVAVTIATGKLSRAKSTTKRFAAMYP
jgi:hypothetical protein